MKGNKNMIGVVPTSTKSFEVFGDFNSKNLVETKLYYDPKDQRLYFYSLTETRSNPNTGYFPVWNGNTIFSSKFSNKKYFDKDAIKMDIASLSNNVNEKIAKNIVYQQRKSDNSDILDPQLSDGDNAFTQCIKSVISKLNITMVDLIDMGYPKLDQKIITSYYLALTKITLMRTDKWFIWLDNILHMGFIVKVFKSDKLLISYTYPKNVFNTGIVKYDNIINTKDDPFKKIIKIIMIMENLTKEKLKSEEVDDYTINNMMTTISGNKSLSAQLFSRFIRMAKLSYTIEMYDKDKMIFEYRE